MNVSTGSQYANLSAYTIQDPVTDLGTKKFYAIWKGARQNTYTPNISTSYSDSQINFSVPPPSPKTIVDRIIFLAVPIQLTFTGNTGDVTVPILNYGVADAFRAFPLLSIIQTLAVTINNNTVSINMNDVFPDLLRYYTNPQDEFLFFSTGPSYQDQNQSYWDGVGTLRNPLAGYNDSAPYQARRGEFPIVVQSNTSTQAVISAYLVTPIPLSPLLFKAEEPGFIGIQNFTFTFSLGDLTRAWSHTAAPGLDPVTSITATIRNVSGLQSNQNAPQLFFRYLTPYDDHPMPIENIYSLFDIQRYPTDIGSQASDATFTVSSQNIQLNTIPRRMYIYARRRNADRTALTTDTFAALQSISINWDNQSGLLSSATQYDLYNMSVKNGCRMSFPEWSGYAGNSNNDIVNGNPKNTMRTIGSMLCVEFGSDIGLPRTDAPGKLGTYQLQLRCTFKNPNASAVNYSLYIVVISEGIFTIGQNVARSEIGIVTEADIVQSEKWPKANYKELQSIYGGDFTGNLKNFFNKVSTGIRNITPTLKKGYKVASDIYDVVQPYLGSGSNKRMRDGNSMLPPPRPEEIEEDFGDPEDFIDPPPTPANGRHMSGGQIMSTSELRSRALSNF